MWYVKKRSIHQILALYMFITPFLLSFLQEFLHFPGIVKYTLDVAWFASLACILFARNTVVHKKIFPFFAFLLVYVLYAVIVYIFEYQSILYFLWGFRNNVRYYIAFIAFAFFIDKNDAELYMKFLDVLFVIHVFVVFVQFFIWGYKWDYLGGVFGVQRGCNAGSLILLIIVSIKALLMYMDGKEHLMLCLTKCGIALVIAAMSEVKLFFLLFIIILMLATVMTRFSMKKMIFIAAISLVIGFAGNVFTFIWGEESALTIDRWIELITSTNYSSSEDLGRITAIPIISKTILTDVPSKLFGLGLGNCDTSAFSIFNTPFYQTYSYLNYNWFSSAFIFLEMGYIGVVLAISFFVIVCIAVIYHKTQEQDGSDQLYSNMAIIMCVMCVVLFFYNSSLRTDIGYLAYFILALPFVSTSSKSLFQESQEL